MRKTIIISAVALGISCNAFAQPIDMIGGADSSTFTMHHCGLLPMSANNYTTSATLIRIVESKLNQLGYTQGTPDGSFGKNDQAAVKKFQVDYGVAMTGTVDGVTAQRLAWATNPGSNVRKCFNLPIKENVLF